MNKFGICAGLMAIAVLAGCSTVPSTNVHQPMSARSTPVPERTAANGTIYRSNYANPLFEDRRARNVGDILTISIVETTSASKNVSSTGAKSSSATQAMDAAPMILGQTIKPLGTSLSASGAQKFEGKGDSSQKNAFSGTITVTVVDVLPNGNLLVSGEKQMGINEGTEYVRFSGVVSPVVITSANTVLSTQVADARIEFKGRGEIDSAQAMGWMTKFFMSVLPF
ncbi:MAG: flagellar basal body L-ring protein FlgH [Sulfuricella sp.]|nr:flagellar basal body L-ring protein FlgH [Sulfuricella sp.]